MIEILPLQPGSRVDHVQGLMGAFVGWHRAGHQARLRGINRYFEDGEFEEGLASLPGKNAPPGADTY